MGTGRLEKEKKRKERTKSRASQRGVGKLKSEKQAYNEWRLQRIKEINKTLGRGAMIMPPPTWEVFQSIKGSMPNAKGGKLKHGGKAKKMKTYKKGGKV